MHTHRHTSDCRLDLSTSWSSRYLQVHPSLNSIVVVLELYKQCYQSQTWEVAYKVKACSATVPLLMLCPKCAHRQDICAPPVHLHLHPHPESVLLFRLIHGQSHRCCRHRGYWRPRQRQARGYTLLRTILYTLPCPWQSRGIPTCCNQHRCKWQVAGRCNRLACTEAATG